jgi:hypothetical protein
MPFTGFERIREEICSRTCVYGSGDTKAGIADVNGLDLLFACDEGDEGE